MPVTAPVSLTKIKTEFNGPDNFSAYVRGGTYVPNISVNNSISTVASGLSASSFLNAESNQLVLSLGYNGGTYSSGVSGCGYPAGCQLIYYSNGTWIVQEETNGVTSTLASGNWTSGTPSGTYEARIIPSDATGIPTADTGWITIAYNDPGGTFWPAAVYVGNQINDGDSRSVTFQVSVRRQGYTTEATGSLTLECGAFCFL